MTLTSLIARDNPTACGNEGTRPKIGLVLSGGGAKGLAHIGVLKVLEEAGIRPDYITGTSMGSIIGGLYCVGYDAFFIDSLARSINWNDLISDRIYRNDISIEEKEQEEVYVGSFPMTNFRIHLPTGLVQGQRITLLNTSLTLPVHHVDNFNKLPIPFRCVATDLETGEKVVLDKGFLPEAMRASMSIPSVFTPVEIDGRLLVDGFLVRNLPVEEVLDMGADIVIGVDVGAPLLKRDQLDSFFSVMEQAINFRGSQDTQRMRSLCHILVEPKLEDYSTSDFTSYDSLITRGERAAREVYPQLEKLAAKLKQFDSYNPRGQSMRPIKNFYVSEVEYQGLEKVPESLLAGYLQLDVPAVYTVDEVEKAIARAYGSRFFERLTYDLKPASVGGSRLVFRALERLDDSFNFGLNYDSDLKSAVLVNFTFRNLWLDGSRARISARLGENFSYDASYFIQTPLKPAISVGFQNGFQKMNVNVYEQGNQIAQLDYSIYNEEFVLQSILSNSFRLGGAVQYQYTNLEIKLAPPDWNGSDYSLVNFIFFGQFDNLNQRYFTRHGFTGSAQAKLVTDLLDDYHLSGNTNGVVVEPFWIYTIKSRLVVPVGSRWTYETGLNFGISTKNEIPDDYMFYLGGATGGFDNSFPFMGLKFLEIPATHAYVFSNKVRWEFARDKYMGFQFDIGKGALSRDELFDKENIITGGGFSLGIMSPIGPLEMTLMKSTESSGWLTHFSIGYGL